MKKSVRILSLVLCLAMLLGLGTLLAVAAPGTITGQTQAVTQTIKVNGTDTGVTHTQILLEKGSAYSLGTTGLVNLIEIKTSSKVQMKVLNGGSYNWSKATMGKSALAYNAAHNDSTVLAAVNGDPWLVYHTDYDGDGQKATGPSVKHVSVSRGIMIIEGELWNSHQIDDENKLDHKDHSGSEYTTAAPQGPAIGFKADGSAIIGTPRMTFSVQNETTGKTHAAGGVNRLPAPNSIILYNHRIGAESFAMTDAYEVYLECEDAAFSIAENATTTGKVVGVYASGSENRPAITEKTVIISARGSSINTVKEKYTIGDSVTITCKVSNDTSTFSQRKQWAECVEVTGGFFYLLEKNNERGQAGNTTNYPCSIIGIKKDGTVLMASTTSTEDGTRSACQMTNLPKLCKELGFYTAILFDGGGSTQMISLEGDSYVRRAGTPDGANSVRPVISGISVVYNGVNAEPTNKESNNRADFFGSTPDAPTTPDLGGADLKGEPTTSYRYYADIATINGAQQEDLVGYRDAASKTLVPGVVSGITVDENNKIVLSGYAFANGGQGDHYWSIDKQTWYRCTDAAFSDADDETKKFVESGPASMTSAHVTNAVFEGLTVDLSSHAGETVTVYVGLSPAGASDKICHYLTMENVAVPAGAPVFWDVNKDVVLHQSFDEVRINDTADGLFTPGQSASWSYEATVDGSVTSLSYWGWIVLPIETIGTFGYQIDDGEPVWDASFTFETEQGVYDAASPVPGYATASRMLIKMDVSALDGEHTLRALYKDPSDKTVIIGEFTLTRDADDILETEPETTAPETTAPETNGSETGSETNVEPPVETTPDTTPADTTAETPTESAAESTGETGAVVTDGATETEGTDEGGCASSVTIATGVVITAIACAFVCKKRD